MWQSVPRVPRGIRSVLVSVCIGKAAKAELQWKGSELQWKSGELQWKGSNQRPVGGKGATSVLSAGLSFGINDSICVPGVHPRLSLSVHVAVSPACPAGYQICVSVNRCQHQWLLQ